MNTAKVLITSLFFLLYINSFSQHQEKSIKNTIFTFNNALNNNKISAIPIEKQALLLNKIGYNGMEFKETDGLLEAIDIFHKQGLKIYADYLKIDIDQQQPFLSDWEKVIPKLKGTDIILWIHLHSKEFTPSDEAADEVIVQILQELADFAKPYGVKLAIYHHIGFLAEKAEDSYRIAQKVNRKNVGSVFNLCHFLKTDSEENIEKVINLTLPKLFAVSINGADSGDTKNMDWDRLIQPLGKGTFDVYRLVEILADKGFNGPIGLQCYNLKDSPEVYLKQSIKVWKEFKQKYSRKNNSLTPQEKKEGWELLFDGKSIKKWRGVNQKSFPLKGWKVVNGNLIANSYGGDESSNGGDIITRKKYSDFILKWEWRMETKGGNSGVKYFVQEGVGENIGYGYGLEYQLLDDKNHKWMLNGKMKPNDYHTVGSLYEIYPASPDKQPNPLGLWNESMIICRGYKVEHWLNGQKILEYNRNNEDFKVKIAASKFKKIPGYGVLDKGHILLQEHGSIIHFRNIKTNTFK